MVFLENVRKKNPLIHCITNYVTANDVANMILAAGASPMMADGIRDVEEMTEASQGLLLNLGTLRENTIPSMELAGKKAAEAGRPIVLDPVGAGASGFRRDTAMELIKQVHPTVIRGNASEIRGLITSSIEVSGSLKTKGVDASKTDIEWSKDVNKTKKMLQDFSAKTSSIIIMSGADDLIVDKDRAYIVHNGHPWMSKITGSGCMMDGVLAAFLASESNKKDWFGSCVYAATAVGICGQLAYEKTMEVGGGTGSYRMYFIDTMSSLTDETIRRMADFET